LDTRSNISVYKIKTLRPGSEGSEGETPAPQSNLQRKGKNEIDANFHFVRSQNREEEEKLL
jgi:hypothetical protein